MSSWDSEDTATLWGIFGGELLGVVNWQLIKENPRIDAQDLKVFFAVYGCTGALGGAVLRACTDDMLGPAVGGILGGVLGSWCLITLSKMM